MFVLRLNLGDAQYQFIGENAGDYATIDKSAGDVDGDGLEDILSGSYYNDQGGTESGKVSFGLNNKSRYI